MINQATKRGEVMQKVYKYGTGQKIPEGAVYLNTIAETTSYQGNDETVRITENTYVWHYFLVDVD